MNSRLPVWCGAGATYVLFAFSPAASDGHPTSESSETAAVSLEQGVLGLFETSPSEEYDVVEHWPEPVAFRPQPIFFPPNAPPLGAVPSWPIGVRFEMGAPPALEALVAEPFYAPLSPKLALKKCSRRQKEWLRQYLLEREQLREELMDQLRWLDGASPEARRGTLESFARTQTPRIENLEAKADRFRASLSRRGLFGDGAGTWNGLRHWRLGRGVLSRSRDENRVFEFMVVRAAVYFHEGFAPAQRRLLREAAMEMEEEIFAAGTPGAATSQLVFFSPETARVLLPATLPADLSALVGRYENEKRALKAELRDAVYSADGARLPGAGPRSFRELSESQAPRLEQLEALAEQIRMRLAEIREQPRAHFVETDEHAEAASADSETTVVLEAGNRVIEEANFEYEMAVYEPGLSPAQRRLLFGSALEKMRLPLPGGELQPTRLPGTIVMN